MHSIRAFLCFVELDSLNHSELPSELRPHYGLEYPINKEAVLINTSLKIDTNSIFTATLYCHTFQKQIKAEIFLRRLEAVVGGPVLDSVS